MRRDLLDRVKLRSEVRHAVCTQNGRRCFGLLRSSFGLCARKISAVEDSCFAKQVDAGREGGRGSGPPRQRRCRAQPQLPKTVVDRGCVSFRRPPASTLRCHVTSLGPFAAQRGHADAGTRAQRCAQALPPLPSCSVHRIFAGSAQRSLNELPELPAAAAERWGARALGTRQQARPENLHSAQLKTPRTGS